MNEQQKAQQQFDAAAKRYWEAQAEIKKAFKDEMDHEYQDSQAREAEHICLILTDIFENLDTDAMMKNPNAK